MNINNLYDVLKIEKNASQQQIIKVSQDLIPKNSSGPVEISREVDQAIMVLTDPQKRIEYDKSGWKEEWSSEWEKERDFRNSIFEEIQNYKHHYSNTYALKPDGFQVYVYPRTHLDPSLLEPYGCWVSKLWAFRGPSWKQELKAWKDKLLSALDKAWEKEEKTPLLGDCWEAVESGDCAKCGKKARLRRKGETSDSNAYCSRNCYHDNWEARVRVPIIKYKSKNFEYQTPELICTNSGCHYKGRDVYETGDGKYKCKNCFNVYLEELKKPPRDKRIPDKNELKKCSNCGKTDGKFLPYGSVDSYGNQFNYCSKNCQKKHTNFSKKTTHSLPIINELERFLTKKNSHREEITETEHNLLTGKTTVKKVKWNPLQSLLNWMKREGITNISLNSQNNLVIEHGSRSTTLKDSELTSEQKEIKEFFQTTGENKLSRNALEKAIKQDQQGQKPKNDWVLPVMGIGAAVLIIILIGTVVYYRNKAKRGY